jgi:hypothetical protein
MSNYRSMIKDIVGQTLDPALRTAGFNRTENLWFRGEGDCAHVIEIQGGKYNIPGREEDFTINLGFWIPRLWHLRWGENPPAKPHASRYFPSLRLKEIVPDNVEIGTTWWRLRSEDDNGNRRTVEQVSHLITEQCLPFLEQYNEINDVMGLIDEDRGRCVYPAQKLYAAILAHLCGHINTRDQLINDVKMMKSQAWQEQATIVEERLLEGLCHN